MKKPGPKVGASLLSLQKAYLSEDVCPEVFKLNDETDKAEVIKMK